jgi:serine phosphatase RsbU (regulator of sigma subunit)
LGIDEAMPYTQRDLTLGVDDLFVIYTDALVEMCDQSGRQLQESGLLSLVRGLPPSPPQRFGQALLEQLVVFRNGRPVNDDQTIVVLRHNASHPKRLSFRQSLNVYAKVFGLKSV